MSGSCRPERRPGARGAGQRRRQQAYTLLEVLIVMGLVGLVSMVALPNLQRLLSSLQAATDERRVIAEVSSLGYRALVLGQSFDLDDGSASRVLRDGRPMVALPEGWRLGVKEAIHYSRNGYCSGGELRLQPPEGPVAVVQLQAPRCRLNEHEQQP